MSSGTPQMLTVSCFVITLKFLTFDQGSPHFHVALGPVKYVVASPERAPGTGTVKSHEEKEAGLKEEPERASSWLGDHRFHIQCQKE